MLAPLSDSCQLPLGNNEAAMLGMQGSNMSGGGGVGGVGGGGGGGGGSAAAAAAAAAVVNNLGGGNAGTPLGSTPPLPSFGFTQEQVHWPICVVCFLWDLWGLWGVWCGL